MRPGTGKSKLGDTDGRNSYTSYSSSSSSTSNSSTLFTLPASPSSPLFVSLALCSSSAQVGARFFVTNDSQISDPASDGGGAGDEDVFEITLDDAGFGSVKLDAVPSGGAFGVLVPAGSSTTESETLEVGLSDTGTLSHLLLLHSSHSL